MATCASCNQVVLFGGIREGAHRFCNAKCREAGRSILAAYELPNFVVDPRVAEIFKGTCPKCGGQGPVDLRSAHLVYSAIVFTFSKTNTELTCHRCARVSRLKAAGITMVAGWWGIPLGVIATPFYVGTNLWHALRAPSAKPSNELDLLVRKQMLEEGFQPQGYYPRYKVNANL